MNNYKGMFSIVFTFLFLLSPLQAETKKGNTNAVVTNTINTVQVSGLNETDLLASKTSVTEADVATQLLQLMESYPTDGATNISLNKPISLHFSGSLDSATINNDTVTLFGVSGPVAITLSLDQHGQILTIQPNKPLLPASTYSVIVKEAKDSKGQTVPFTLIAFSTETVEPTSVRANQVAVEQMTSEQNQLSQENSDKQRWQPEAKNYLGNWTSKRTFKHSRDYIHEQEKRYEFIDSLSQEARDEIMARWMHQGMIDSKRPIKVAQMSARSVANNGTVTGQILRLDGEPLANVTVKMADKTSQTDNNGNFTLPKIPVGGQVLEIDGRSANQLDSTYGRFDYHMVVASGLNELDFTIWMPKLDTKNVVNFASPSKEELIVTHPDLPGLELRVPANAVIRDKEGNIVTEIGFTPIPVDQIPFPMPYMDVPVFFTLQPGGATIHAAGAEPSPGAYLVYPNYSEQQAGARVQLFDYDPKGRGWYTYTMGTVNETGKAIIPDKPFKIYQLSTVSSATPGDSKPPESPPCGGGHAGDPVSCASGLFLEISNDLSLDDTLPLNVSRSYRQNDNNIRSFGVGAGLNLDWFLSLDNSGPSYTADYFDLVDEAGRPIRFLPVSGNKYTDPDVYFESKEPGAFYGAKLKLTAYGKDFVITRLDGTKMGFSYYNSRLLWLENREGKRISLFRDSANRLNMAVSPNGRWLEFSYGVSGCSRCISSISDNTGRKISYEYNNKSQLIRVTDAMGGKTDYSYDANNRMLTVKDPLGQTTGNFKVTNIYDVNGRVAKQTYADGSTNIFAYTLNGNKITTTTVTNEGGNVRKLVYDDNQKLVSDTYAFGKPEAQTISYQRNAQNLLQAVTDPLGRVTRYDYDASGNVTKIIRNAGRVDAISESMTYEPKFQKIATATDPMGNKTSYFYDDAGRLIRTENSLKQKVEFGYNNNSELVNVSYYSDANTALTNTMTYDKGNLTSITDGLSRTTHFVTDSAGRLVKTTDPLGYTSSTMYDALNRVIKETDAAGNSVNYHYDANGNLLSFTDAAGKVTKWAYDVRNRPIARTDALNQVEKYSYDPIGNLLFMADKKGQVRGYSYDSLNRLTKISFGATSMTNPVWQDSISYEWDKANRVIKLTDSLSGVINWRYDDRFDAIIEESFANSKVNYSYNVNGLRESMVPTDGSKVSYSYDAAGRPIKISQAAGSHAAIPASPQHVGFAYDLADRQTQIDLPNGIKINFDWDNASQLTNVKYSQSNGSVLGNLSYGYDAAGRKISTGGSLAKTDIPDTIGGTVNANNQLTHWAGKSLSYDANGNMLSDGNNSYRWNSRNQLISISGSVNASFSYDGLGRRMSKTVNGITTKFVYDGNNPIQEKNSSDVVIANLFSGLAMDEWYGRTQAGKTITYLPDALGSALALSDGSQTLVANYSYQPYGKTTVTGNTNGNSFAYTGRENDGTGLYYYRARYYHPDMARFISEDPIGLNGGFNLYGYVGGNPVSFRDPLGLHPIVIPIVEWTISEAVIYFGSAVAAGAILATPGDTSQTCGTIAALSATECNKEWAEAKKRCTELPLNDPLRGGHVDDWACAKGFVSAACGGNKLPRRK